MKPSAQVDKDHYRFEDYVEKTRWMSFYYQIQEILAFRDAKSILEIGPGMSLLRHIIERENPDCRYATLDIAEDLEPDLVGSATDIPAEDGEFDAVVAFQILEHLPYDQVPTALAEIRRVAGHGAILSLPHFGPSFRFQLAIPMLPKVKFAVRIPYPKEHKFDGEHYWEIGKRGYPAKRLRAEISEFFHIEKEFVPFEMMYHRFYICRK